MYSVATPNRTNISPVPTPTSAPTQKIDEQLAYKQEYQRVSAKIKRLVIEDCQAEYGVETVEFSQHELDFIDKFSQYMTEKNGYVNPERIDEAVRISHYQREYDRRMFEAVAKNPLVIKYKNGLINLHLDVEDQLKKEEYVENNDHQVDNGQIQEDVVNDEGKDREIEVDKAPQSQVNVRVRNSKQNRDRGMYQ
jgi:hypothetical protein